MNLHSVRDCLTLQNIGGDLMAFEIAGMAAKAVETGKKSLKLPRKQRMLFLQSRNLLRRLKKSPLKKMETGEQILSKAEYKRVSVKLRVDLQKN